MNSSTNVWIFQFLFILSLENIFPFFTTAPFAIKIKKIECKQMVEFMNENEEWSHRILSRSVAIEQILIDLLLAISVGTRDLHQLEPENVLLQIEIDWLI